MANIKSAKKRILVTRTKTAQNRMVKSAFKTSFVAVTKALDSAAQKGVVHKNMAARKKSRLAAKLNALA